MTAKRRTSIKAASRACRGSIPYRSRSRMVSPFSSIRTWHAASVSPSQLRGSILKKIASSVEFIRRALNAVPVIFDDFNRCFSVNCYSKIIRLFNMSRHIVHIRRLLRPSIASSRMVKRQAFYNPHLAVQGIHHNAACIAAVFHLDMNMWAMLPKNMNFQASRPISISSRLTNRRILVSDHSCNHFRNRKLTNKVHHQARLLVAHVSKLRITNKTQSPTSLCSSLQP